MNTIPEEEIDREALIGEMVTLHYMESVFNTPVEVIRDFLLYNMANGVSSGFTTLKVTSSDVGKTVLEYMVDVMPKLASLARYQYATILKLPESRSDYEK